MGESLRLDFGGAFQWYVGFLFSVLIAGAAYLKKSLSLTGVAAAVMIGTLFFVFGGLAWSVPLVAFFVSSSFWTSWKKSRKEKTAADFEKSGARDGWQVLANGGAALALCLGNSVYPHEGWWIAFAGVMAAVTADTWATEIGSLSSAPPRSIMTGREIPPGTSGGVSFLGLWAAAIGGLFIGWVCVWIWRLEGIEELVSPFVKSAGVVLVSAAAGLLGSLGDSFIGAKWQRQYRCPICGKQVETGVHCGNPTNQIRGLRWINNDVVNFTCSLIGGVAATLLWFLFV